MASTDDPSQLSRDQLKARVEELEQRVETLEHLDELITVTGEVDSHGGVSLEDILIGGNPIGALLQQALEQASDAHDRLDGLSEESDGFSEATRDQMLPAHRMAVDIQHGHEDRIGASKRKRASELFRRMMHKVHDDGEPQPGVENSNGAVKITSSDAQEIIRAFDDDLETVSSMQVTRAFEELQRLTKRDDCDCESIENCSHGLVMFKAGATNTVAANTARLIEYLDGLNAIETSANEDVRSGGETSSGSIDADDAGNSVEADADDTLDQLAEAGGRGENGAANDVVSSNERSTLGAENGHGAGDTHE
jgi:hypothetical protein